MPQLNVLAQLNISEILLRASFGTRKRIEVYRNIVSFLEAGVPIHNIFGELALEYGKTNDSVAKLYEIWAQGLAMGRSLSEIMSRWIPSSEASIIRAGEESGALAEAFHAAIQATQTKIDMISSIRKSLTYPAILILTGFGLMMVIGFGVMPTLVELQPPEKWPANSQQFYAFTDTVRRNAHFIVGFFLAIIVVIRYSMPRMTGPVRNLLDKIPPYTSYKYIEGASFLISVANMMKNGRAFGDCLTEIKEFSSPYMRSQIDRMQGTLQKGKSIGEAIALDLFPRRTQIALRVYSKIGEVHREMDRIGLQSSRDTVAAIASTMAFVRVFAMAAVVGYLVWTYLSIFSITDSLQASIGA